MLVISVATVSNTLSFNISFRQFIFLIFNTPQSECLHSLTVSSALLRSYTLARAGGSIQKHYKRFIAYQIYQKLLSTGLRLILSKLHQFAA